MSDDTAVVRYEKDLRSAPGNAGQVRALLLAHEDDLTPYLPEWVPGVTVARIISTAVQCVAENQAIARCTGTSILSSVKTAVEFGLSFAKPLGQAYLVPFKQDCTLIIGYRGLLDLIRRAAEVDTIQASVVYAGDVYEPRKGGDPDVTHKPDPTAVRSEKTVIAAYMVSTFPSGRKVVADMTKGEIDAIRQRSRASHKGPWQTDYAAMALKTVIRHGWKMLPVSAEKARLLESAIEHDNRTDGTLSGQPLPQQKGSADLLGEATERDDEEAEPGATEPEDDDNPLLYDGPRVGEGEREPGQEG